MLLVLVLLEPALRLACVPSVATCRRVGGK